MRKKNESSWGEKWYESKEGGFLLNALAHENERGQVLIATAFLDKAIKECLHVKFKKEGAGDLYKSLVLNCAAPLSSFWSKIHFCRAFGLISKEDHKALDAVREIRNEFAHANFCVKFSNTLLVEQLKVLEEYTVNSGEWMEWTDKQGNPQSCSARNLRQELFLKSCLF